MNIKKDIPIIIRGLSCFIPRNSIESLLVSRKEESLREFDLRTRKMVFRGKTFKDFPLYSNIDENTISVGIGAILFLKKHYPELNFIIKDLTPERKKFDRDIIIPSGIINSKTFKVNGKERYYFYEALEQCKRHNQGMISLATGSGKSEIEITLAYNQEIIFGTQLIVVPTISIRDQMIQRAASYNIDIIDYRDLTERLEKGENLKDLPNIIISAPTSILNDFDDKKHLELLKSFSCLIVDEAHRVGCDTWTRLFLSLPNVYRIHGFSAMPVTRESTMKEEFLSMDERDAVNISVCGDVIYHKSPQDLKEFLNIPILVNYIYNWKNYDNKILNSLDWNMVYKALMNNKARSKEIIKIIETLTDSEFNVISYVSRKQQGINLLQNTENEKICCWFSGEFHLIENREICKKSDKVYSQQNLREEFGESKRAIIVSQHAIEGLDFSAPLNALVLTEMKSERENLQKTGRIVRPGSKRSFIINFVDLNVKVLNSQARQRALNAVKEFGCQEVTIDSLDKLKLLIN